MKRAASDPEANPARPETTRSAPSSTAMNPVVALSSSREGILPGAQHQAPSAQARKMASRRGNGGSTLAIDVTSRCILTATAVEASPYAILLDHLHEGMSVGLKPAKRLRNQ